MNNILHIATLKDWERAQKNGEYKVESLDKQGFIHCSKPEQVIKVANFLFKGREDLILLSIDPSKVQSEIKYEAPEQAEEKYPHIYGPLNLNAVDTTYSFKPNYQGYFDLPDSIK